MALSLWTHLWKVQYNNYNRLTYCIGGPCFSLFFFNTTLSALSHRPQLTSDTISHYNLTLLCLSFQLLPAAQEQQLEHLQNHKGVTVPFLIPVSPFNFVSHHSLLSKISCPWLCYPFKLPSSFFSFLLAIFHSERLSCDLLYISSIRTVSIFLCFFIIHIFAIYLNRNIYVHTFENKHISYLFIFFYCEGPDVTFHHCKTFGATLFFLERSLLWD